MDAIRPSWERIKPLFGQAVELSPAERIEFLGRVAADDESLARELAALLEAHDRTESLGSSTVSIPDARAKRRCFRDGEILLERFQILRFVADGGMGEVYEAHDLQLGRVALKTVRPGLPGAAGILARFRREVQLSRRVTDTRVCRVHDLFTIPSRDSSGPVDFLTMEYLEGVTLAERIAQDGPLPPDEAREIALQLCSGVEAIHAAGVIHRDLKARNIMLRTRASATGPAKLEVVIMDLGLARETRPDADGSDDITMPNAVMGTPAYMAPEQFQGALAGPSADIYALGVVFYEMLTGVRPFQGANAIAAAIQRAREVPPPSTIRPGIPRRWDSVIRKCLEFDPERRFASAAAIAAGLSAPAAPWRGLRSMGRLRLAAIALALGLAISGAAIWNARSYPPPSPDAERWYEVGLEALRDGASHKATQALSRATSLDPDFLLAHATLADAWAELDYIGKAKDEMLKTSELAAKWRLPSRDAKYVDAVRSALTFNYRGSLEDYRAILDSLPQRDKPYGYVDAGRAYEKSGDIAKAIESYRVAARLAPEFPASFVRLGILQARLGNDAEADAAFAHAKDLYSAASDPEGVAEVAWQRAYALSVAGNLDEANTLLGQVMRTARDIHSPQLEARALSRMSVVAYLSDKDKDAADLARRAIDLSREKGLEYWEIDALMRLGNAQFSDPATADATLQHALRLAHDNQHPRLEAGVLLSLASLRNQQDKPDECLAFARSAFDYYSRAGFVNDAIRASLLIGRTERNNADLKPALPHALEGLSLAMKLGNKPNILLFEELAGSVLLKLERYSDAVPHFDAALRIAGELRQNGANQRLYLAETFMYLGRYDESQTMLDSIPADAASLPRIATAIDRIRAYSGIARLDFRSAKQIAVRRLAARPALTEDLKSEFLALAGEAALRSGARSEAGSDCRLSSALAEKVKDRELLAEANLCLANYALALHDGRNALARAEAAAAFYSTAGKAESEAFALLALAKASYYTGDQSHAREYSLKALDRLEFSEHNQGNPAAELYRRRPDLVAARTGLAHLSKD